MSLKITFIGAGSLVFARTLFTDIMSVPELQREQKFPLQILIRTIWRRHGNFASEIWMQNGIPVVIEATTDRRAALKDARYIVNCVRVGGLKGLRQILKFR